MISKNWRYSRGDIYYANMEPHVGSEQGGERPVVVLQNDKGNKHSSTIIIATLTSRVDRKPSLPTHVLLDQNSSEEMERIETALKISLGMNLSSNKT